MSSKPLPLSTPFRSNKNKSHSIKPIPVLVPGNVQSKKVSVITPAVPTAAEPLHHAHETASTLHSSSTSEIRHYASDTKSTTDVNSSLVSSRASSFEWGTPLLSASDLHDQHVRFFVFTQSCFLRFTSLYLICVK